MFYKRMEDHDDSDAEADSGESFTEDPEEYAEHVNPDMDVREVIEVLCDLSEDSKVKEDFAVEVAKLTGRDHSQVTRAMNEYISLVEVVELEDGYVQARQHFDKEYE